jgi:hypothetical protein
MERVNIVLCEGQHDIAFITRVLKADGFKAYNNKVKNFISPLNNQFEAVLKGNDIGERSLGFQREHKLPSVALRNDHQLVLFHNIGGDGNLLARTEVISMYKGLKGNDDFTSSLGFEFRFIFVFDADDVGVNERVSQVNQELGFDDVISQGTVSSVDGFEYGCYIFHDGSQVGDLEDIILTMITNTEEGILSNSQVFLTDNQLCTDRTKEYICTHQGQSYKTKSKFKFKKSQLSVAGQLQFSGMSNSVFISNTDFLTYEQLTSNSHCTALKNLFY